MTQEEHDDLIFGVVRKLKRSIPDLPIDIRLDKETNKFTLNIQIGGKTGDGLLVIDQGFGDDEKFWVHTRYGRIDEIGFDEDIVEKLSDIAWYWYLEGISRGYDPNGYWLPLWIEQGLIEVVTETVTHYRAK